MIDTDSKLTTYLLAGVALGLILGGALGYFYSQSKQPSSVSTAVVENIAEKGGLFELTISLDNNESTTVYVSKALVEKLGVQAPAPPSTQPPLKTQAPTTPPPAPEVDMGELVDDDPVKGNPDAQVVIVEFSDFQCPFCERFAEQTLPELKEKYIDTGKVKLIYRDFPLSSIHPEAQKAAEATECADDQGKFWAYHDILFEKRSEWSGVGAAKFKEYAVDLGLDTHAFDECLDSDKYKDEVLDDLNAGQAVGVTGTPTFFINGQKLVGAQPFTAFETVIDEELAKPS